MSEQIDCRCKRCHCWPCECDDAVSITKSTTLKCDCDIGEYCEKCGGTKEATPMERDREIAEKIADYVNQNYLSPSLEVRPQYLEPSNIATILAAERENRSERIHKLLKELATNSKETIVLLYVNRIREELK